MGSNPINLAFRFLLELAALFSFGSWGWKITENWTRYLFAIILPLIGAIVWGVFTVPDDPSRSGGAPISVPGWLRLVLELTIFCLACLALAGKGSVLSASILGSLVVFHYAISYDRIQWLLARKND